MFCAKNTILRIFFFVVALNDREMIETGLLDLGFHPKLGTYKIVKKNI